MKKITELTQEQLKMLPKQAEKWLKIGLSTEPLDFEKAKMAVIDAYKIAGLDTPKYFFKFESPFSAAIAATLLKKGDQVVDQVRGQVVDQVRGQVRGQVVDQVWGQVRGQVVDQVWGQVYGAHDASWLSFYETMLKIGVNDCEKLKPLMELAEHCGWWVPYKNCVILQDRPCKIIFDDQKRLHCEDGPAIQYRDGLSVYSWHGTRIPKEWVLDKNLDAKKAIKWGNMEQRRAACEIVGWNNILHELNAESIDKNQNPFVGELLKVHIPDIGEEKFLRVKCGTEREFALPVPPDMERASQAQAWLNFTTEDVYLPQVRT